MADGANGHETRDLVDRSQRGDREAFDVLVARCRPSLLAVIRSRTSAELRRRTDVEDLFQETVLRALHAIERFEWHGEGSFPRWLHGIAGNVIRENARRLGRDPSPELRFDVPRNGTSPSQAMRREERFTRLQTALQKLSPDHRAVILLARVEQLKIREIAERMDRTENSVKNLLLRALRALRQAFGDTESLHLPAKSLRAEHEEGPPAAATGP